MIPIIKSLTPPDNPNVIWIDLNEKSLKIFGPSGWDLITGVPDELLDLIERLEDLLDSIEGGDLGDTIDNLTEIKEFLEGFKDSDNLKQYITNIVNLITQIVEAEKSRAEKAESDLSSEITEEADRAKQAESDIQSKIEELEEAVKDTEVIDKKIEDLESSINDKKYINNVEYSSYGDYDYAFVFKSDNEVVKAVDVADFLLDKAVEDVLLVDGTGDNEGDKVLRIIFNTDAGSKIIDINVGDVFNADNYYTSSDIDSLIKTVKDLIAAETTRATQAEQALQESISSLTDVIEGIDNTVTELLSKVDENSLAIKDTKSAIEDIKTSLENCKCVTWAKLGKLKLVTTYEDIAKAVLWDGSKKIIVDPNDFGNYGTDKYTPIGVVVIPSSHDVYKTGEGAMMSIVNMSCNTPYTGSNEVEYMYWGRMGVDLELTNLSKVPVIDTDGNITGEYVDTYMASDYYSSHKITSDIYDTTRGYKGLTYRAPSPFLNNGSRNPLYYSTELPSSTANVLADFDGIGNTKVILAARGGKDYSSWKPTPSQELDYPAASCCDIFYTVGTKLGDWYLPAMGELGYTMANYKAIYDTISLIKNKWGIGTSHSERTYCSSSESSSLAIYTMSSRTGTATPGNKYITQCVMAFARV